ncbi:50S ribosomal protein L15 [Gemmatimonadota bacterium]
MGRYEINPSEGSRQTRKRIGRGTGSGTGKTSGKGHKGQKARSGYKQRAWFEGGQMPLQRRVPKRGFKNPFRTAYDVVNVGDLERVKTEQIDKEALKEAGLIRSSDILVKVLGNGKLDKTVNVTVDAFSASARTAIETAGGTCTVIQTDRRDFRSKRKPVDN